MRRLFPATLAAALVLLVGCSDDEPRPPPTPTAPTSTAGSPTPSPTPTGPVEPTMPPEAAGEDAAAAEAFVEYFWEMSNYAQATGDVQGLRRLGAPGCAACKGGADGIERVYSKGGSMNGGELRVTQVSAKPFVSGPSTGFAITLGVSVREQRVLVPGEKEKIYPGGRGKIQMILEASDQGWIVQRWDSA